QFLKDLSCPPFSNPQFLRGHIFPEALIEEVPEHCVCIHHFPVSPFLSNFSLRRREQPPITHYHPPTTTPLPCTAQTTASRAHPCIPCSLQLHHPSHTENLRLQWYRFTTTHSSRLLQPLS